MQITMPTFLKQLNPSQREAVTHGTGPLLIIAGPGSGKTCTVVHSIAYAIENGEVPDRIVAFTFTRKAISELKDRVTKVVGQERANNVWISTFHSFCGSVLSQDVGALGIGDTRDFTVKELTHNYNEMRTRAQIDYIQHHRFAEPDEVLNFINKCEERDIRPLAAGNYARDLHMPQDYVEIYKRYEQCLEDDGANYTRSQLFTNALFRDVPEVKVKWQEKFNLIFVDEYQDTDPVQYRIIKALAEKHRNLRVVGDDDQGIYGFRGADIQNILNFEKDYPDPKVITLEQNYRSTQRIVKASHAIADFNPDRREKELFTINAEGEKVKHLHCADHQKEATIIADFISRATQESWSLRDFAILYRTNLQAAAFKKAFADSGIPFVVGESSDTRKNAVFIMTIHKSKGLEFPNVFVTGVCTGLLPHHKAKEKDWDEELRLLYVAMTRAKNWLCLSSYDSDDRHSQRGQSPFLGYIPSSLLESINTLQHTPIPSRPEKRVVSTAPEETSKYGEPLSIQADMTVLGVDPGVSNVGWSITQKTPDGYTVHKYDTERPTGELDDKLMQIQHKINALTASNSPDAIAVEKLEGATDEWFRYVAGCVALIRRIADRHDVECHLYTPQHVKYVATGGKNASKLEVQRAVKKMCNLQEIPQPDHSADAIAVSLCYLRNYLNSSRFQGNARKQEHCKGGYAHLDDGQYGAAVAEFKEAINIDPILTDAHSGLGRAYLGQGDLEAAENEAKKALRLDTSYQPAHELLKAIKQAHCDRGDVYLGQGKLETAEKSAKEALRLESNYLPARELLEQIKQAYYNRGLAHLNNEQYGTAVSDFKKAININPIFKAAHCDLGWAYLGQDDLEAAENAAKTILRFDNNYSPPVRELLKAIKQAYCDRGNTYLDQGKLEAAEKSVKEALNLKGNYSPASELLEEIKQAYYDRGLTRLKEEKYGEAVTNFKGAININSSFKEAYCGLGRAYYGQDALREAENVAQKVLELDSSYQPAHKLLEEIKQENYDRGRAYREQAAAENAAQKVLALYNRGSAHREQDNWIAAENVIKEAFKLDSSYQPTHKLLEEIKQENYDRGRARWNNNQHDAAVTYFKRAMDIDIMFKEAHCGLGRAYYGQGDLEKVKNAAQKVLELDSSYQPAHKLLKEIKQTYFNRGRDYLSKKQYNEAVTEFKKVIDIDPEHKNAHYCLGEAYYWSGMFVDAICSYQAATVIDSNDKIIYLMLGITYSNVGSYGSAISQFQKAIDIDRNCKQAHLYLGRTYFRTRKLEDAKQATMKALDIDSTYQRALQLLEEIKHRKDRSLRLLRIRK